MTTVYRIQEPLTGLFSSGGYYPKWTKNGKVWSSRSAISNHFHVLGVKRALEKYGECKIIEYELTETKVQEHSAYDDIAAWNQRAHEAAAKETLRVQKLTVAAQIAALEKARKELENLINPEKSNER